MYLIPRRANIKAAYPLDSDVEAMNHITASLIIHIQWQQVLKKLKCHLQLYSVFYTNNLKWHPSKIKHNDLWFFSFIFRKSFIWVIPGPSGVHQGPLVATPLHSHVVWEAARRSCKEPQFMFCSGTLKKFYMGERLNTVYFPEHSPATGRYADGASCCGRILFGMIRRWMELTAGQ